MVWWKPLNYLQNGALRIYRATIFPGIRSSLKATMCAGFEITGGTLVAIYTYENCNSRIWPILSSAVAVRGIFIFLTRIRREYRRSTLIERDQMWSAWNLATGTAVYISNICAFSEALKRNNKLWMLCLGIAASGYYYAASSLDKLDRVFSRMIYLKCFQKMFEPILVLCSAIYLLEFRNHQEGWLQWGPFAIIAATGIKTAFFGFLRNLRPMEIDTLLLKWIEIVTGGCLIAGSCAVLTVYTSVNNFHNFWTALMFSTTLCGIGIVRSSLEYLMEHLNMDPFEFYCVVDIIIGPVVVIPAGILLLAIFEPHYVFQFFLLSIGTGLYILGVAMYQLYNILPTAKFISTCLKVWGPIISMYGSIAVAYVGCRKGWHFSIPLVTCIPLGIFISCLGFRVE